MTPTNATDHALGFDERTALTPSQGDADTVRAARLLIDREPGPGSRLDALLFLAGQESLWRTAGPGADLPEAVRRYEAATGRALPRATSLPSFGAVKCQAGQRRGEVAVWLAGRFLGWLASPSCGRGDAEDWRAEERLLIVLGVSRGMVRIEPPRALLDVELRVIELARAHIVERGACV